MREWKKKTSFLSFFWPVWRFLVFKCAFWNSHKVWWRFIADINFHTCINFIQWLARFFYNLTVIGQILLYLDCDWPDSFISWLWLARFFYTLTVICFILLASHPVEIRGHFQLRCKRFFFIFWDIFWGIQNNWTLSFLH